MFAILLAAASAGVLFAPAGQARRRLLFLAPSARRVRPVSADQLARLACALAGLALGLLFGWPAGLPAGLLVGWAGPRLLMRLESGAARRDRLALVADLPLVLDLLAACLAGGSSLPAAAAAVAGAVPGPCGRRLAAVAGSLAAGGSPGSAWSALSGGDPDDPLSGAARLLGRSAEGGTPVAAVIARLAVDARADAGALGEQRARRLGVLVVAPLGLCFLPAFVLLGIVPVVVGLATPLLGAL